MTTSAHSLIEVRHLSKRYGRVVALDDVSFDVRAGEVLGLIGPNGAGKTTLFECMAGVLPYDRGSVRLASVRVRFARWPAQSATATSPIRVAMSFGLRLSPGASSNETDRRSPDRTARSPSATNGRRLRNSSTSSSGT
jgi:ABC-type Mn2+/Zn2+ transport system ATPase subunit